MFNVVFGKVTTKKHKTWDNDGFLEVLGKNAVLKVIYLTRYYLIG